MKRLFLLSLIFFLLTTPVLAQDDHPIDKRLEECMDNSKCITLEMRKCGEEAYAKWEEGLR